MSDVAAEYRPRYEAAATEDERRAVLQEWDAALEGAEPAPAAQDDFDEVIQRTASRWEVMTRRGTR